MSSKRQREIDDSSMLNPNKKSKLATVFDGTYFEVVKHDVSNGSISTKCLNCKKENIIRGNSSSTGNFFKHYLKVHRDIHEEMKNYCDEKSEHTIKKRTRNQSVLPFTNMLDPKKVSLFFMNFSK